jgi:hypothetical protein
LALVDTGSDDRDHRRRSRFAPEVVDHDVDVAGGLTEALRNVVSFAFEQDGVGCADRRQLRQPIRAARRSHDPAGAEQLGDLHCHLPRVPGGGEHEHALPRFELDPLPERHPRGHGRVHRRSDSDGVGALRQHHATAYVDDGLLRHRAHRRIGKDEVAKHAVWPTADAVDTRHERQLVGARVVRSVGLRSNPGVEPGRQHVDKDLVFTVGNRDRELEVSRWCVKRIHDGGVHGEPPEVSRSAFIRGE